MFLHPDSEYGQGYDLINTDEMKEITEKRPDDLFRGSSKLITWGLIILDGTWASTLHLNILVDPYFIPSSCYFEYT